MPLIKSTSLRTLSICVTPCRVIDLLDRASRNVAGIIDKDIDAGGFVRAWELKVFGYINLNSSRSCRHEVTQQRRWRLFPPSDFVKAIKAALPVLPVISS